MTGQLYDETDLWYLQQMSCLPTMLSPRVLEEWHAARAANDAMTDALEIAATYFEDLTDTQRGRMRLPPVIAIGHNAHTPPLQDLLESYQHPILCIRRLSHSWYAVDR